MPRKNLKNAISRRVVDALFGGGLLDGQTLAEVFVLLEMAREEGGLEQAIDELRLVYGAIRDEVRPTPSGRRAERICRQLEQLVGRFAIKTNVRGARDFVVQVNHEKNKAVLADFTEMVGEKILRTAPKQDARSPTGTVKLKEVAPPRRVFR